MKFFVELWRLKEPRFCFAVCVLGVLGFLVILSYFINFDPNLVDLERRLASPSWQHLLGCDFYGRDILSAVVHGTGSTLLIAFLTTSITTIFGVFIGLHAGFFGGVFEQFLMRAVDVLMAFPGILLNIALAAFWGPSTFTIVAAISITGWTSMARIVHAQVLSLKQRDFVQVSRSLGSPAWRIMLRDIFPLSLSPVIVHASFSVSSVIIIESSLSFLGLGKQDGAPTWGEILSQGQRALIEAPLLSIVPGLLITITVLALNFLGDSLQDRVNS